MSNKYGEILLKNVSLLDKMSNSGGKISKYAIAIVNSQDSLSTVSLYRILYTIVESKKVDEKTLNLVKNIKDNLISFYGYQRVFEICNGVSIKLSNSEEKESSLSELQAELNQLVGLENVKSKVNDLIIFQKVQQLRKNQGLNTSKNTLHLAVFNP